MVCILVWPSMVYAREMSKMRGVFLGVVAALTFAVMSFQACQKSIVPQEGVTPGGFSKFVGLETNIVAGLGTNPTGNGNGYEGKLFSSFQPQDRCVSPDGKPAFQISKRDDGFYVVRKNCIDIVPELVARTSLSESLPSPNIVSYEGRIYEFSEVRPQYQKVGDRFIYAICRGQTSEEGLGTAFADGVVYAEKTSDGKPKFFTDFHVLMAKGQVPTPEKPIDQLDFKPLTVAYPAFYHPPAMEAFEHAFYVRVTETLATKFFVKLRKQEFFYDRGGSLITGVIQTPTGEGLKSLSIPSQCDWVKDFDPTGTQ